MTEKKERGEEDFDLSSGYLLQADWKKWEIYAKTGKADERRI